MLQQLAHSIAEPAVNKALYYDAESEQKLAKLNDKSFSVILTDLSIQVKLFVQNQKLKLSTNIEEANCTVKTSSKKLNQLTDAANLTKLIKSDELELDGDLHIAQQFSSLLLDNNIDWRELLSSFIGDAAAYKVHRFMTNMASVIKRKLTDLDYTAASALTDELAVTPNNQELSTFSNQVDSLTAQCDALLRKFSDFKAKS